jgi:hypothetical protein
MDSLTACAHGLLSIDDADAEALLDHLRPRIDDGMLLDIASCDYGMGVEEYLAALRQVRDDRAVLGFMSPHLVEVFALTRWSEPDDPDWRTGATGCRGHLMRAFVCAAMLRSSVEPDSKAEFFSDADTLAQLLASLLYLGSASQEAAARFFAWRVGKAADAERPFSAFALLFLVVLLADGRFPEDGIASLAEEVIAEEKRARDATTEGWLLTDPWLLSLTNFHQKFEVWLAHARRLRAEAWRFESGELRGTLELITSAMLGG